MEGWRNNAGFGKSPAVECIPSRFALSSTPCTPGSRSNTTQRLRYDVEIAKVLHVLRRAPHRPARRFIYGRQGRNLSSTGSHWQPLAATGTSHTSHTMCTIHHATTAIALFSFSCSMQTVTKLWSSHSEEVRNFNKQNKYATSWAPFKTTPVPLPMARDRSWQKSCSSRSTYRVHIGSVYTAFDSFHHSSQPGVLCPLCAFATVFPSCYSSFPKQRHISTHDPADRAPKERSPQAASLDKSSWNMIEHVSKQL